MKKGILILTLTAALTGLCAEEAKPAAVAAAKADEVKVVEQTPSGPKAVPSRVRAKGPRSGAAQSRRGFSLEELKKDPVRYAQMTNRMAQANMRQKEMAAKALATLKAVDTKFLGEDEKKSFTRLQELMVQRDADRAAFKPGAQGPEVNELRSKMMKTQSEIRELNRKLKSALARALFQEAGADAAKATKLAEQMEAVNAALR